MKRFEIYRNKEHFTLARLDKAGERFEISVDPELALKYAAGQDVDIRDVLKAEEIFKDAKKGMAAPEHLFEKLFNTKDVLKIADIILKEGEIQLTQEHREKLREQKLRRIIDIIHQNGVNPKTDTPIPPGMIESALKESKVRIEDNRSAEDQVAAIVKKIQAVLPIRIELKEVEVKFSAVTAPKSLYALKHFSTVVKDTWNADGSLTCLVQVPAGMFDEFVDKVNAATKGEAELRVIKK